MPTWYLVLQTIANAAIAGTFVVYFLQLKAMSGQLAAARDASLGQNLLAVHSFIFEETFRQDRRTLIELGEASKSLATWTPEERRAAERVCAAYNLVGLLIAYGVIPFKLIGDLRYSMTKCHAAAEPLLSDVRTKRTPELWHHFSDVVERFQKESTTSERREVREVGGPPNPPMQPTGLAGG